MSTVLIGSSVVERLEFQIAQADLIANNTLQFVAPISGFWSKVTVAVQTTSTNTGTITAKAKPALFNTELGLTATLAGDTLIPGTGSIGPVLGLPLTVTAAAAAGTIYSTTATAGDPSTFVVKGQLIQLVCSGFATAGAVNGSIEFSSETLSHLA
jgi:hypothetical protein